MKIKYHNVTYDSDTGLFTKIVTNRKRETFETEAGWIDAKGYRRLKVKKMSLSAHRLAWFLYYGEHPKGDIDHINGIKNDNRIENLRDVSKSINLQNRRTSSKGSTSKFLGVSWNTKLRKWRAQIKIKGKTKQIGIYEIEEEAYAAYLQYKRKYHEGNTL